MANLLMHYVRLQALQHECFRRGKRRWAVSLGEELHALIEDNPILRRYL